MSTRPPDSARNALRRLAATALPYVQATADAFAETLWPTRCALCDEPGSTLCPACERSLPYIDHNRRCIRCGAPFGLTQCCECNAVMLEAAGRESLPFAQAVSAVSYDEAARAVISAYKDHGERRLARDIARIMVRCIPPAWLAENAALTFIPASQAAFRRRGFDHAELIAAEIAQATGLELLPLYERPRSFDQRQLSRGMRMQNMRGIVSLSAGACAPEALIIVDDVRTTGATMFAACDALAPNPPRSLYCLTFAQV